MEGKAIAGKYDGFFAAADDKIEKKMVHIFRKCCILFLSLG